MGSSGRPDNVKAANAGKERIIVRRRKEVSKMHKHSFLIYMPPDHHHHLWTFIIVLEAGSDLRPPTSAIHHPSASTRVD
jgi:hypothetical protein